MRTLLVLLLFPAISLGQSIIVSGGNGSIMLSGKDHAGRAPAEEKVKTSPPRGAVPVFEEVLQEKQEPILVTADDGKTQQYVVPTDRPGRFGFSAKMPPAVDSVAESQPILRIYTTAGCDPCNRLKAAIQRGELYGVGIRWYDGGASSYPTIVNEADGKTWGGFGPGTISQIRSYLGIGSGVSAPAQSTKPATRYVQPSGGMVRDQWGDYDPSTYLGCGNRNCAMCNNRRAVQSGYRQTSYTPADPSTLSADQQPTPEYVIDDMLRLISPRSSDVLGDLGCGDGRILITAVKRYRCRGVGVELDPVRAEEARKWVRSEGLENQITIVTGDVRDFNPKAHGVTVITAYLFPELLVEIAPLFDTVRAAATPFHPVPGLRMTEHGDVWLYRPST